MLMWFFPLIFAILGFYLYMSYVEKATTHNSKIFTAIGLVIALIVIIGAMIAVTNFTYFILAGVASYKLGLILHTLLEKKYEFFQNDFTEYIIIVAILIAFILLFLKLKEYFIVFTTAALGSSFVILSFHYFKLTDFDFLFELEFSRFKDIQNLESQYINFLVVFFMMSALGAFIQVYFFVNKKKKQEIDIELNFKN